MASLSLGSSDDLRARFIAAQLKWPHLPFYEGGFDGHFAWQEIEIKDITGLLGQPRGTSFQVNYITVHCSCGGITGHGTACFHVMRIREMNSVQTVRHD